jgi:hypothetical protein
MLQAMFSGLAPKTVPYRENALEAQAAERTATAVFEALVCEIHALAHHTAIVASAANALRDPNCLLTPAAIEPYAPRDTTLLQVLRAHMIDTDFKLDELMFVDEFLTGLPAARDALDLYTADAASLGLARAAALHQLKLAEAWRHAAHLAFLAVRELGVPLHRTLSPAYGKNSIVLTRLLAEAKRGGTPCLDSYGRIASPPLPQQRRAPRRMLCEPCTVRYRGHEMTGFARDISAGGIGLERVALMLPGEQVLVTLENGRSFSGLVAWGTEKAGSAKTFSLRTASC